MGGSVLMGGSASSSGWFLGDFGWFLLVESDFRWFQVVCCFSSYISFTAYRTLNSLLYSWLHVIDRGHSIFLFKVKQQKKNIVTLSPSRLKKSDYFLCCVLYQIKTSFKGNLLNKQSQNTKQIGILRNIWDEEFWRRASEKFSKTGRLFALTGRR